MSVIRLVQGDTLPAIAVSLFQDDAAQPVDLRGCSVALKFRAVGAETLKDTRSGVLLAGYDDGSGYVDYSAPYDQANGRGGRVQFSWGATTLDTVGDFEGEIVVTTGGNTVQTVYPLLRFHVRPRFPSS